MRLTAIGILVSLALTTAAYAQTQQITLKRVDSTPFVPGQEELITGKLKSFEDTCEQSESSVIAAFRCMREKALDANQRGEFGPGVEVLVVTLVPTIPPCCASPPAK